MDADLVGEIQLLLFSMNGVKVGVDTEEVFKMIEPEQLQEYDCSVVDFMEKVRFRNSSLIQPELLRILLVKPTEEKIYGIRMVQPDEILTVKVDTVRKLPSLLAGKIDHDVFWAACVHNGELILLADIFKLLNGA